MSPQGTLWDTHSPLPCVPPGECLITGQSHFKSFDNRHFTFSGVCQYLLARDCQDHSFSIIIETIQVSLARQPQGNRGGEGGKMAPCARPSSGQLSKGEDRQGARGSPEDPEPLWNNRSKEQGQARPRILIKDQSRMALGGGRPGLWASLWHNPRALPRDGSGTREWFRVRRAAWVEVFPQVDGSGAGLRGWRGFGDVPRRAPPGSVPTTPTRSAPARSPSACPASTATS